jgi:SAM-dependent methyltransferase
MDVREMPYEDEFDLVWCNIALSHTWGADPEVIEALKRALKPGGWLVVSDVPHPATVEDLRSPSGRMFVGVTMYVSLLGPGLLTQDELLEKLGAGGFRQVVLADQPARTRMMVGAQKA